MAGSGAAISQRTNGSVRVDSGGDLVVGGNVNVGTGTLTLNASGAITRFGGILTAATLNLGAAGGATAIGVSGTPIVTAATSLLDARATTGAGVFLTNTGNVNLTASAASGAVNVVNTGSITTAPGGILAGTTIDIASDSGIAIGHAVNAGGAVNMSVSGAAGAFSHTAASLASTGGAISLSANLINLSVGSTIDAGTNAVNLYPYATATPIRLGDNASGFALSDAELDTINTSGTLTIGRAAQAGSITVAGAGISPGGATGAIIFDTTGSIFADSSIATNGDLSLISGNVRDRLERPPHRGRVGNRRALCGGHWRNIPRECDEQGVRREPCEHRGRQYYLL